MKTQYLIIVIAFGFLTFMCAKKSKKIITSDVSIETIKEEEEPEPPPDFKISAYLLFDDQTLSSFDVLNNKKIALWNTIIGAGDALKPSHNIKIILTGKQDNINIKVINGKKTVID